MPTPRAICASSTVARMVAPSRVFSMTSHSVSPMHDGDADHEDAVERQVQAVDHDGLREHRRRIDVERIAGPDIKRGLLEQEREADGQQHLPQRVEPNGRKNTRSITKPISATVTAATGIASSHEPVVQITDSAT